MPINTATRSKQVKVDLLNYIKQSGFTRNDPLPSEALIAKQLGVSRNTVREAYILLEKEGVIVRRHGIGTFVANSHVIQDPLNEFLPFAQIIQKSGYAPGFETLSMSFEQVTANVYEALNVPPDTQLRHIKRLVRADRQPVIYVDDFISPIMEAAGLHWDAFDGSMVAFLSSSSKFVLNQIQSRIRVTSLTAGIARILELAEGIRILNVWSTIFTTENQPVAFSEVCFNSDFVELNIVRSIRT